MVFPPGLPSDLPRVCLRGQARPGQAGTGRQGGGSRNSQCLSQVKGNGGLTHNALARMRTTTTDKRLDEGKGPENPRSTSSI